MGIGSFAGGLSEGVGNGISLYNALQQGPMQRQAMATKNAMAQQQLADLQNRLPIKIGGQQFTLPQEDAAKFAAEIESRKMMMNAMLGREAMKQDNASGKLTGTEQNRLDATKSAVPVHNTAMALYQAYQDAHSPDPGVSAIALTQLKQKLASNPMTRPYAEQVGNSPENIPAIYDAVVTQGAMEQPRLATGSVVVPQGEDLAMLKAALYPALTATKDEAYGKFNHFTEAYIKPAYEASISHLQQGADPATGEFSNPYLARSHAAVQAQYKAAMDSLYQMPGMGTKGTPVPEIQGVIPSLQTNGAPLPNAGSGVLGMFGIGAPAPTPGLSGSTAPAPPASNPASLLIPKRPSPLRTSSGVSYEAL